MKKMKKYIRVSLLALLCTFFMMILCITSSAIEIDETNPNIEPYIMDIEGLHSSISAINTVIKGNMRLATFYVSDFTAFAQYVNSLDWSRLNNLPELMGLNSGPINNISKIYYSNIDEFRKLIGVYGQMKYYSYNNDVLNNQISFLETQLQDKDLEISSLNSNITYLIGEISLLQNDKNTLESQIGTLESQIGTLESQIESLNTELGVKYNEGYNEGFNDNKIFLNGLATIFSSPMYVFGEVFDFELLGFNILTLIQMFLTIMLVAFIFKKVR